MANFEMNNDPIGDLRFFFGEKLSERELLGTLTGHFKF